MSNEDYVKQGRPDKLLGRGIKRREAWGGEGVEIFSREHGYRGDACIGGWLYPSQSSRALQAAYEGEGSTRRRVAKS